MNEFTVTPDELIEEYLAPNAFLQHMLDEIGGWGTGQAEELASKLGRVCESDNTFNYEYTGHLTSDIQFHVLYKKKNMENYMYDDNTIILIEIHGGGDIRGNY